MHTLFQLRNLHHGFKFLSYQLKNNIFFNPFFHINFKNNPYPNQSSVMHRIRNQSALQLIKNEIEGTLGKKIVTSGDCIFLAGEIDSKTGHSISPNTLRRLFGLVKATTRTSVTTLDILARYCGFSTLDEFVKFKKYSNEDSDDNKYPENILNYLLTLFTCTPVKQGDDTVFNALVKLTTIFPKRHPELYRSVSKRSVKIEKWPGIL